MTSSSVIDRPDPPADRPVVGSEPAAVRRLRLTVGATVVGAFGLLFARALRFVYVDGDDAASVAFHTAGRDPDVFPPFGSYHAGADLVLGVFPASEQVLRVAAIAGSALCTVVAVLLMLDLARLWLSSTPRLHSALLAMDRGTAAILTIGLLAAFPELAFLSLVYLPSMVGLCLVLGALHLVRHAVHAERRRMLVLLAAAMALTGLGVAIRWDLGLMALIGVADLALMGFRAGRLRQSVVLSVWWGLGSVVVFAAVLFISPTAAGFDGVFNVVGDRASAQPSLASALASSVALLTPGLGVLCAWGLVVIERGRRWFVLGQLAVAGCLLFVLNWSVPKAFAVFFAAIVFVAVAGLVDIQHRVGSKAALILVPLILLPWMVGVRVAGAGDSGDTAWGPGFELQDFDRIDSSSTPSASSGAVLGAGMAVPTPEGPRSLWGFGSVLFGGGWPELARDRAEGRAEAVVHALETGRPLVQLEGSIGLVAADLAGHGLDPVDGERPVDGFTLQDFSDQRRQHAVVGVVEFGAFRTDPATLDALTFATGSDTVVAFGYSSTMRELYQLAPEAITPIGPEAAIVDLVRLEAAIAAG